MTKYILIPTVCTMLVISSAVATVTRCVKLSADSTCTHRISPSDTSVQGTMTCGGIPIQIIAGRNSIDYPAGHTLDNASLSSGAGCWCKMIYPAETQWVYSGYSEGTIGPCLGTCAEMIKSDSNVHNAFFNAFIQR